MKKGDDERIALQVEGAAGVHRDWVTEMFKRNDFVEMTAPVAEMARARGHAVTAHDEGSLVVYGFPPWENLTASQKRRVQLAKDCRPFRGLPEAQWTAKQFLMFHELSQTAPDFVVTDTMFIVYALHLE